MRSSCILIVGPSGGLLAGILDNYSQYIIAWKLCSTMKAEDVTDTLELALTASGCDQAHVQHKPRLLSDNGSSYISGDLAEWLGDRRMKHVRGAPYHPQTQGKIESWHQTLKDSILLEKHYYGAISKLRSRPSSSNVITSVTMKAWATRRLLTPTLAGIKPSTPNALASNA